MVALSCLTFRGQYWKISVFVQTDFFRISLGASGSRKEVAAQGGGTMRLLAASSASRLPDIIAPMVEM